jgi:hypothetical protein
MKTFLNEWNVLLLTFLVLHWQESAENPLVFCYRMGVRLTARMRRA